MIDDLISRLRLAGLAEHTMYGGEAGSLHNETAEALILLRDALAPFARAAKECRIPVAGNAAQWLAWEDFARAASALAPTKIEKAEQ